VNSLNPFVAIGFVGVCFAALIAGLTVARQHLALNHELSRKLVHVGMGLVTLSFPWLFSKIWAVWLLSLTFLIILILFRLNVPLSQRFGSILGGVERQSWGEFYFPLAVAIVFTFSHLQVTCYLISLLVLTLADAAAALVGTQIGRNRYRTEDGWKSMEGSLAFFAVAFVVTVTVDVLIGREPLLRAAIIGVCIGVLAALVEAISWRGLDNLFLPVATLAMLFRFAELDTTQLWPRPFLALGLLTMMWVWRTRTTLRGDALAGGALTLYLCWAIGGWRGLQPPLVIVLVYTFLPFRPQRLPSDVHGNLVVLSLAAVGFFWMFLAQAPSAANFWLPCLLSFAVQLSMVFLARWKRCRPATATALIIVGASFSAWLFVFVPGFLLSAQLRVSLDAVMALAVVAAGTLLFWLAMGQRSDLPNSPTRWLIQSAVAMAASCTGLLPIFKSCPA